MTAVLDHADEIERALVRERYAKAAAVGGCCGDDCCPVSELPVTAGVPAGADLGLSSGHPVSHAGLRPGEWVVDLGSGAGVDVFLAAREVAPGGRVIGVDMTPEMLARARQLATENHIEGVEFREGIIEKLPVADGEADVVLSNCVVNLSPDKAAVFREAFRVLKPGGRLVISDIVKEREFVAAGASCGCVDGAMVCGAYTRLIEEAGFERLEVLEDRPWHTVAGKRLASALTLRAWKPGAAGVRSGGGGLTPSSGAQPRSNTIRKIM